MPKKIQINYKEAKKIVSDNGIRSLKSYNEWEERESLGLPAYPRFTYMGIGWSSSKDFFIKPRRPNLQGVKLLLEEHNIKSHTEYTKWDKKQEYGLPSNLYSCYKKEGFTNVDSLLGVEHKSLNEQSVWMQANTDVRSHTGFIKWSKEGNRPSFISSNPNKKFLNMGWDGWLKFLGAKSNRKKVDTFRHKDRYTYKRFKLTMLLSDFQGSVSEYNGWRKSKEKTHTGLPYSPSDYYKDEWEGWEAVGIYKKRKYYYTLESLIKMMVENNISTTEEYKKHQKKDRFIPSNPLNKYPELKRSFSRLFGKEPQTQFTYLNYKEAQTYSRKHLLFSSNDYFIHQKKMSSKILPSNPHIVWKDDWVGWEEFLNFSISGASLMEIRVKCELDHVLGKSIKYKNYKQGISEIDIYYPKLNLGVEYNGAYWHHQKQDKDLEKFKRASKLGMTVVHILESSSQHHLDLINEELDVRTTQTNSSHLDLLETIKAVISNLMTSYIEFDKKTLKRMSNYLAANEYQAYQVFNDYCTLSIKHKNSASKDPGWGFFDYYATPVR